MSEVPTITCQQCGYDLSNLKAEAGCSPRCPECGHITLPLSTTPNMHWASKATLRSIELGALLIRIGSYGTLLLPLLIVFLRGPRGANAFLLVVASAAAGLATVLIGLFKLTTLDARLAAREAETGMHRTRSSVRVSACLTACGASLIMLVKLTSVQAAPNSMLESLLQLLVVPSWVLIPPACVVLLFAAPVYSRWLRTSESQGRKEGVISMMSGITVLCAALLFVLALSPSSPRGDMTPHVLAFSLFLILFVIYLETFATTGRAARKLRKE
jgi:hypothetical protein